MTSRESETSSRSASDNVERTTCFPRLNQVTLSVVGPDSGIQVPE